MSNNILNEATQLIQVFEGFESKPYQDSADIWTVGIGFTIWNHKPVTQYYPSEVSSEESSSYLETLVSNLNVKLLEDITVSLTDNQNVALLSFCYNIGIEAFRNSTMLKDINEGDFSSAANEFPKWNQSAGKVVQGLVTRRSIEQKRFMTS
ncbi:lysozyme [Gluconacetobacter diazotrophicus]|uniref:lysozyme n=1 Tax=Gluconacetobacter diazotrophicus TaxID=33996 RepID=UPI0011A7AFDC|nr:lysozyme [Gluconacetobacter diazotrophicus]